MTQQRITGADTLGQLLDGVDVGEDQRTGDVSDHCVAVTLVQRLVVVLDAGHVNTLVVDLQLGQTGNHQDQTETDTDYDRNRQVEYDGADHGDDKFRHGTLGNGG